MKRVTFSIPWPLSGSDTRGLLSFAFQTSLVSYLVFFLIENIQPGFVTGYANLNWWLWATIITGAVAALWPQFVPEAKQNRAAARPIDYGWSGILVIGTIALMWYRLDSLGTVGRVVAILSGVVVFCLNILVAYDREKPTD